MPYRSSIRIGLLILSGLLVACRPTTVLPTSTPDIAPSLAPTEERARPTGVPTETPIQPTALPTPTETAEPTQIPQPTPTWGATTITTARGYVVTFTPHECPITVPQPFTPQCGSVTVPEDRSLPDGRQVQLPVMIFRSSSLNPEPDPVIYLTGGGGMNQLESAQITWYQDVIASVTEQRDFIFYNQRGATFTEPALACPGYADLIRDLAGEPISASERYAAQVDFWLACQDDLLTAEINLEMYNSMVNAADAADVRTALGYQEANYYATSYGTRFGLDMIRDYPEGVRSIILDSVYPPHINYYSEYGRNALRAFEEVFATCKADADCRSRHPDLEDAFYEVVDRLNRSPETFTYDFGDVIVDGGTFMECVYLLLYSGDTVPDIPALISTTHAGDLGFIRAMAPATTQVPDINLAVFYSTQCREETPFDSFEHAQMANADLPSQIADLYVEAFAKFHFDLCAGWRVRPADAVEQQATVSDVPTLVLAGQFDPITPPEWGRSTTATLPNSHFYEFPGLGHGIMRANSCGLAIGLQFLDNPLAPPDAACIGKLPAPRFR